MDGMGGFIGGVLQAAGTSETNSLRSEDADKANASMWERMEAQEQWSENMSNTSYQRAVKDMEAAGLNPMLAYSQGGANTPSAPGMPAPVVPQRENPIGTGLSSATAVASAMASIEKMKADTKVADAQADNTRADTLNKQLEAPNVTQRLENLRQEEGTSGQLMNESKYRMAEIQRKLDSGYYENIAKSMGADTALTLVKRDLGAYELPAARNEAAKAETPWGRKISPFLSDFGKFLGSAQQGSNLLRGR